MEKGPGYFISQEDIDKRLLLRIMHMTGELPGSCLQA
jgi:hypothetical protein